MKYQELINKAKAEAINSLKIFLKKLSINENLMQDIYDTDILVKKLNFIENLEFDHDNFKIYVNETYLEELTDELDSDQATKQLAKSIIHEMLHANRVLKDEKVVASEITKTGNDLLDNINNKFITNDNLLLSQRGFEESITEVIALIVFLTRNTDDLSINAVTERIRTRSVYNDDEKVAALIVDRLGVDMLKWFMLSTYTNEYHNYFKEKYGTKYETLVQYVNKLYLTNEPDFYTRAKAEEIVNNIK